VLLSNRKSTTRRNWNDAYARRFRIGDVCKAYDKNPRAGGREVAKIQILKAPYRQPLSEMTDEDLKKEGEGLWGSVEEFAELFKDCENPYVLEFRVIEIGGVSCLEDQESKSKKEVSDPKQLKLF